MHSLKTIVLAFCAAVLLSGCTSALEEARKTTLSGSETEFEKQIYNGYVALAEDEKAEGEAYDSSKFANRAKDIANGILVRPEPTTYREIPASALPELQGAYARLLRVLAAGGREIVPVESAQAQINYDCWMEEQEDNSSPEEIAECRSGFFDMIAKAEAALAEAAAAAGATAGAGATDDGADRGAAAGAAGGDGSGRSAEPKYIGYFGFNDVVLTDSTRQMLREAAAEANANPNVTVIVGGHADRAGPESYNLDLSERRARAAEDYLVSLGVLRSDIVVEFFGETRPAVETPDGVAEPANRRVTVSVQ